MYNEIQRFIMLLVLSFHFWISTESVYISEQSNFSPCSFNDGKLLCDAKTMQDNTVLQFQTPSTTKIEKLEVLNFPLEEIPANYISPLADNLLSIKIYSSVSIKTIDPIAFGKCSKVISVEIKSQLVKEEVGTFSSDVFRDLISLEQIRLINFNINDLNLNYLRTLKSLTIENSFLNSISVETFRNNPQLTTLNIIAIKNFTNLLEQFAKWPTDIIVPISSLNFRHCNLRSFPKLSSSLTKNLFTLTLTENPIEKITVNDTADLKELSTLQLSATTLDHNSMNGLRMLTKLKILDFSDTKTLKNLPVEIEDMQTIESLKIDMCQFDEITITLPSSVKSLSAAYLKSGIFIRQNFLSKCNKLDFVNLNGLITSDPKFLLDNVKIFQESLLSLNLEETLILKKELWIFLQSLKKLEILNLGKANIDSIPNDVLINLISLKKLLLSGNALRYESINTEGFQNIAQHLEELDLSHNPLYHLPPCLFYLLPTLNFVDIRDTNIDCDCNLRWLYNKIQTIPFVLPKLNFTCATGKNTNLSLYKLTESHLSYCSSKIENCSPIKTGIYGIEYSIKIQSVSNLRLENINATHLKYLFDYMKVNLKQGNRTLHSFIERYPFNQSLIEVNHDLQYESLKVCIVLVRNMVEYDHIYNCQSVIYNKVITEAGWTVWIGVGVGIVVVVVIISLAIFFFVRRSLLKAENSEEKYSNCSTQYSEPNDTYQNPDQYTEISSNDEYTDAERSSMAEMSHQFNRPLNLEKRLNRMTVSSKSFDEGLDLTRISGYKSRFQKSRGKSSRNFAKRHTDFTSLHNINVGDQSLPRRYSTQSRISLPRQYVSRDLPVPPEGIPMQRFSLDNPPPKPKFPSTDIKNLLSNADSHLDYFRHYASNNSLCTDESVNHPHSGDSGLGVSKLSNHSQVRVSEDNSVII